jgi:hypothetical protein
MQSTVIVSLVIALAKLAAAHPYLQPHPTIPPCMVHMLIFRTADKPSPVCKLLQALSWF